MRNRERLAFQCKRSRYRGCTTSSFLDGMSRSCEASAFGAAASESGSEGASRHQIQEDHDHDEKQSNPQTLRVGGARTRAGRRVPVSI
eukprot:147304-Rhodomonas_salina.1